MLIHLFITVATMTELSIFDRDHIWCSPHFTLLLGVLQTTLTPFELSSILTAAHIAVLQHLNDFLLSAHSYYVKIKKKSIDFECCTF